MTTNTKNVIAGRRFLESRNVPSSLMNAMNQ